MWRLSSANDLPCVLILWCMVTVSVTLPLKVNDETLQWFSPLPILVQIHSGGDDVALGLTFYSRPMGRVGQLSS